MNWRVVRKYFWLPGERAQRVRGWLVPRLIYALARLVLSTLRVTTTGLERGLAYVEEPHEVGAIFITWHDLTLTVLHTFRHKNIGVIVSPSRWGRIQATVAGFYGWPVVWGTRRKQAGVQALREVVRVLRTGQSFALATDGPRGPRHQVQPGVVFMASRAPAVVMPLGVAVSAAWQVPTWDRYLIPKPFARVHLHIGEPLQVPPGLPREEMEEWRGKVEAALHRAQAEARQELARIKAT
jgi:lysophospholipid acyltransferase (LPLAT)-like uncharacterized protein